MPFSTPAHKQTDPSKAPGQWVNPNAKPAGQTFNHDMMDDMAGIATPAEEKQVLHWTDAFEAWKRQEEAAKE